MVKFWQKDNEWFPFYRLLISAVWLLLAFTAYDIKDWFLYTLSVVGVLVNLEYSLGLR